MAHSEGGGHAGPEDALARVLGTSRTPGADLGLALTVTALAALLWRESDKIPPPFFDPLGSAAVPRGIAAALVALALLVALRAAASLGAPGRGEGQTYRPRPDIALGIVALAVGYLGAMQLGLLGFPLATIVFLVAASALLGRFDRRTVAFGAAIAVIMGVGGTWLFTEFFYIDLPR